MMDETIVIEVTGQQLLTALENGVSQYPVHEGRFPQVCHARCACCALLLCHAAKNGVSQYQCTRGASPRCDVRAAPAELCCFASAGENWVLQFPCA